MRLPLALVCFLLCSAMILVAGNRPQAEAKENPNTIAVFCDCCPTTYQGDTFALCTQDRLPDPLCWYHTGSSYYSVRCSQL